MLAIEGIKKRVPFLAKIVFKRVRGWTSEGAVPYKVLLSTPGSEQS